MPLSNERTPLLQKTKVRMGHKTSPQVSKSKPVGQLENHRTEETWNQRAIPGPSFPRSAFFIIVEPPMTPALLRRRISILVDIGNYLLRSINS